MALRRRAAIIAGVVALLAACQTGQTPVTTAGTPFTEALAAHYGELVERERSRETPQDVTFFADRRTRAQRGEVVAPATVFDRELGSDAILVLAEARLDLMALLQAGARDRAPELAAEAQAYFDCWLIRRANGRSEALRGACRNEFRDALTALDTAMADLDLGT